MAERSQDPSSELGPDLSSGTKPTTSKKSEASPEKDSDKDKQLIGETSASGTRVAGQDVLMAERIQPSSSADESDISSPTPPKRSKIRETSSEEVSPSAKHSAGEVLESSETLQAPEGSAEAETVQAGSSEQQPVESCKVVRASVASTEVVDESSDIATAGPSGGNFGTLQSLAELKYTKPKVLSESSTEGGGEGRVGVQVQTSLMGEHALYEDLSLIGNGAYGTVYKAKDLNSGQIVALKKVRVPLTEDGLPTSTLREIAALKQLERFEHPHIVRLLDVCQGNYLQLCAEDTERSERIDRGLTLWLVFEHVERDLASYMSACPRTGIPSNIVRQMSKEILLGVEFLHSHRIIHRDLKPQNLLVTRDGHIKIADFGLAKTYDFEMRLTSVVVTQWYRAPEVLLGCSYATPVDMWSVGCIIAELSKLEPLFPGTSEGDQLDRIFQVTGTPSQREWPEDVSLSWTAFPHRQPKPLAAILPDLNEYGLDLIKNIIVFNPHNRLTAAQAIRHQYFTESET